MTKLERWARHGLSDPMLVYIARSLIEEGQANEPEAIRLAKNFREGWNVDDLENDIQMYANEYDEVVNCVHS